MTTNVIHFPELPYYLTVKQIVDGDTVRVQVESKIHVNRVVDMPTQFSVGFVNDRPNAFRNDVLSWVIKRYGLTPEPVRYS